MRKEVTKANQSLRRLERSSRMAGKALKAAFAVVGFATFTRGFSAIVIATNEQQRAVAELERVIKSTGNAAGLSAPHLIAYAGALQQSTTYGDEAIIGAQSLLATFKEIGAAGGVFDRATKAALVNLTQSIAGGFGSGNQTRGRTLA